MEKSKFRQIISLLSPTIPTYSSLIPRVVISQTVDLSIPYHVCSTQCPQLSGTYSIALELTFVMQVTLNHVMYLRQGTIGYVY